MDQLLAVPQLRRLVRCCSAVADPTAAGGVKFGEPRVFFMGCVPRHVLAPNGDPEALATRLATVN